MNYVIIDMKKLYLIVLLALPLFSAAQKKFSTYLTPDGDTLRIGDTLYVGKPAAVNGETYKYILGMISPKEGQRLIIKSFSMEDDKCMVRLFLGGITYYHAPIDYALDSKEILARPVAKGRMLD